MLIGWSFRDRDTVVQALDPRARMIFTLCLFGALIQAWDLRWLVPLAAIALGYYLLARLSLRETWRFWLFAGSIAIGLTLLTAITRPAVAAPHPWFRIGPVLVTVETARFAAAQLIRVLSMSLLAILIPFTLSPAYYGVTFRGLGLNDRLAFAMDLSLRFVPSLTQDFASAMDAQKARGFELDRAPGGIIGRIRNLAPLVVPVTIGAIVGAEEMVDAMELRAFGTRPRTWYASLQYRARDRALILLAALILGLVTLGHIRGWSG
jgi:energy-coupling factor transport system permease protein